MRSLSLIVALTLLGCSAETSLPVRPNSMAQDATLEGISSGSDPYDRTPGFDFADMYYRANGVEPTALVDRLEGQDGRSVIDASPNPDFSDTRILETTGGFDHKGNLLYYVITGKVMLASFTPDAAGQEAREIANDYRAFLFPKVSGNPLAPAPSNRRQDNLFDTRHGYFSNNPLGLWRLVFVSYTDAALTSEAGRSVLVDLADRNGLDLDGTPVIRTVSELENLEQDGWVAFRMRDENGTQGFPWVT